MRDLQPSDVMAAASPPSRPGRIRLRAVVVALLLLPVTVVLCVFATWQTASVGPSGPMFGPGIAALLLFSTLNHWLQRRRPRWAFTSGELILVYAVIVTCAMANGVYMWFGPLASVLVHPIWAASDSNQWASLVWPNLPPWLTVTSVPVLEGFFLGDANPYQREVLAAWAQPAFWWAAWVTGLLWVCLCLNVIIRRRWSVEEKLAFPMTELPLRLTEPEGRLFQSRLWWIGFGVALSIGLWNLLARFYPAVPAVPLQADISARIATGPLNALRCGTLNWGFWALGLSYLMPLDMMFSIIVFNLMWRTEYVVSRLMAWNMSAWSGFPYGDEQSIGAYLAVLATVLWVDRGYLVQVLRKVVGLPSHADDREEPFSYRVAVLGIIVGVWFLVWFFDRAGVRPTVGLVFLGLYFAMMLTLSRLRAQIGPPDNEIYGSMPPFFLTQFPGTRWLGPKGVAVITLMSSLLREQTNNPSPVQLEALRMAERRAINPRLLALLLVGAVPIIVLVYFWAYVHLGYHRGLEVNSNVYLVQMPNGVAEGMAEMLRNPGGINWSGTQAIGVGALITAVLMMIKLRFPTWPLHPVAFPIAWSWPIDSMLPAITVSWLVKLGLLRYGGLRAHRTALPLFLGFIMGDAVTGLAWQLLRPLAAG